VARLMFDSDVVADLPRNSMCATYSDLIPDQAALDGLRAEFPLGLHLIDRKRGDPTGQATIIDIEDTMWTPPEAPGWYDRKAAAGLRYLTAYANRSTMPAVIAAMGSRNFFQWIARLDGTLFVAGYPAGKRPALVQFAKAAVLGFHCDGSVVWQDGWNPVPASWPGDQPLIDNLRLAHTNLLTAGPAIADALAEVQAALGAVPPF